MRKSSKILAILLTVVMLLGIVSVISAAAETPVHPTLSVEGDGISTWSKGRGWTFEGANYAQHWSGITGDKAGAPSTEIATSSKSHAHFDTRNVMGSDGTSILNTYGAFWADKDEEIDSSKKSDTYFDFQYDNVGAQAFGNKYTLINNDFMTIDFDLASDMFIDENGNLTDENTDKLAYGGTFATYMRANGNHWETGIKLLECKLEVDADLGPVINVNGNKFPLQKTAGTWNHVTIILATDSRVDYTTAAGGEEIFTGYYKDHSAEAGFSIVKTYASNTMVYLYIDGVYCYSAKPVNTSVDTDPDYFDVHLYNTRWLGNGVDASWSHCVDNVVASYFATGYAGPISERFDFDGTHPKSLGNLTDMIYNYGYQYSAPNKPAATLTPANGTPSYYYNLEAATARLAEGDTLKLEPGYSIKDYVATFPFLVKCEEGAFTIHEDCNFRTKRVEGGYEVLEINPDDRVNVQIFADYDTLLDITSSPVFEGAIAYGKKFDFPEIELATGLVNKPDGTTVYNTHIGWKAYYLPEEEFIEIPFDPELPIGDEYLDIIADLPDGGDVIYIVPVYEEKRLLFAAYDLEGKMIPDKDGSYVRYTDPQLFYECIDDASTALNGKFTVKLLGDVYINGKTKTVTLGIDSTSYVNIDINGYTLAQNINESTSKPNLFNVKAGTFNLYSSRPGARIFNSMGPVGKDYGQGYAAVNVSGKSYGVVVNIGGVNGADGDNLSIYSSIFVCQSSSYGWKQEGITPETATVNIIGAHFYRENPDGYGGFKVDAHLELNISGGATFVGKDIISVDARCHPRLTMNVDGATFISTNGNLINQLNEGSVVTFKNTKILGVTTTKIQPQGAYSGGTNNTVLAGEAPTVTSNKGTVILGVGTEITLSLETIQSSAYDWRIDTEAAIPTAVEETIDATYYTYSTIYKNGVLQTESYNNKLEKEFKPTLLTKLVDKSTVQLATVEWFDEDGITSLGTSEVLVGEIASPDFNMPVKTTGNGWYDLTIDGWLNLDGTEADLVIDAVGTYQFKGVYSKPVLNMEADVLMNVQLADKYTRYLYIPNFFAEDGLENVEIILYKTDGTPYASNYISSATVDGKSYKTVRDYPDITSIKDMAVAVSIKVNGVESEKVTFKMNMLQYYTAIYDKADVTEEEKILVTNTLRYVDAMQTYVNSNKGAFTALIEQYKDYLIDMAAPEFEALIADDASRADIAELQTVLRGVTFYINTNYCPVFSVIKAEGVEFDTNNSFYGYKTFANKNDVNMITLGYTDASNPNNFFNLNHRISAYYYTADLNVQVKVGEDVYTGVYNLGKYITEMDAAGEAEAAALGRIIYAYSIANIIYQTDMDPLASN